MHLPGLSLLAQIAPRFGWRRHAAAAGLLLALTTTTAAFADPTADVQVPRDQATIMVALDVSLSMSATDVSPDRITAAKAAAAAFVTALPARFQVGLVSFSGSATALVPPTQDHSDVVQAIKSLQLGGGTAIGEAVLSSVQSVEALSAGRIPAHVVLLSDGANTQGRPISDGVQSALAAKIPVSTIAYGTPEGVVEVHQYGRSGLVRVPVDAASLAELATQTGGKSYTAASGDELQGVYADIGSSIGTTTQRRAVGAGLELLALAGIAAAGASSLAWSPRVL